MHYSAKKSRRFIIGLLLFFSVIFILSLQYFSQIYSLFPLKELSYYEKLTKECTGPIKNCCLDSVRQMEKGNYTIRTSNWCPAGYISNLNRCNGSYIWCEPLPITNFNECVAAGNPVMESYPRMCKTAKGDTFYQSDIELTPL